MSRLSEIYEGWKNYVFLNPRIEEQAKKRMEICVNCDKLLKNNSCKLCGCYMPAKVRSPKSYCYDKKW
jgi:hypothetical protein